MRCQEEMKVANDYWRCVQSRSYPIGSRKMMCINIHKEGERKGGRLGIDGLYVVTKKNAWKTVR